MRDPIDTTSADTLLDTFKTRAREEYEKRMTEIDRKVRQYLDHDWSRDLLRAMLSMDSQHRWQMFGNILYDTDGAKSIAGMEAILSFIGNYVMDDSFCHAVPYVPKPEVQEVYREVGKSFRSPEESEQNFSEWMAYQARWKEIVRGEDADGRYLRGPEIVAIIAANEALHAEEEALYESFLDDDSE